MNAVQKFALVAPETIAQNRTPNHPHDLDLDMKHIMELPGLAADIKVLLYQDRLTKFLSTKAAGRPPLRVPTINRDPAVSDNTDNPTVPQPPPGPQPPPPTTPARLEPGGYTFDVDEARQRVVWDMPQAKAPYADRLLEFLKEHEGIIRWGDNFELLDAGVPIEGADLRALVHYASRDMYREPPAGWDTFLKLLRDNEVPNLALGSKFLRPDRNVKSPYVTAQAQTQAGRKRRSDRVFHRTTPPSSQGGRGWLSLYK